MHFLMDNTNTVSCKENQVFLSLVSRVVTQLYDVPGARQVMNKADKLQCSKDGEDAVKQAQQATLVLDDPFTKVLDAKQKADLDDRMNGKEKGNGLELDLILNPMGLAVREVLPGSPAALAGLKPGDKIEKLNGKPISEFTVNEITALVNSASFRVEASRDGKPLSAEIKQAELKAPKVLDRDLGDGIAYIRIRDFVSQDTDKAVEQALRRNKGAKAFVLDLRNNPGGRVVDSLNIASMLVEEGKLAVAEERLPSSLSSPRFATWRFSVNKDTQIIEGEAKEVSPRKFPYLLNGRPLVVLVNGHSASASELLTGALMSRPNILIAGEKTYGKGVGQIISEKMPGGNGVNVTNIKFFAPNGLNAGDGHNKRSGFSADIPLPKRMPTPNEPDSQINDAKDMLKGLMKVRGIAGS